MLPVAGWKCLETQNFVNKQKNIKHRQYFTLFVRAYSFLKDLGSETYLEFEIWSKALGFCKFRLKTSSWRNVMT